MEKAVVSWIERLPSCLGQVDGIFAGHPSEEKVAKEVIKEAKAAGVGLEEFLKELLWVLWRRNFHETLVKSSIEKALGKAEKMW